MSSASTEPDTSVRGREPSQNPENRSDVPAGATGESGEGKVTRLELFSAGVMELEPEIRELIRTAA